MRSGGINRPDAGCVVGGTSCQMADVRRKENASDVGGMGHKLTYGQDGCSIATLDHTPNVDVALLLALESTIKDLGSLRKGQTHCIVSCANHTSIARNRHTGNADIVFRNELVGALVLAQVPNSHVTAAITADQFSLVRVNDYIIDGDSMGIVALDIA